jgi:hypothetical protein
VTCNEFTGLVSGLVLQVLSAVDKVFGEKAFDTFQLK